MAQSPELKTSLKQRIGIAIVAVVLLGSTAALYMGIVLSYNSGTANTTASSEKEARFEELYAEYQTKLSTQASELSAQYFDTFVPYKSNVKSFNAAAITEVAWTDLALGDGEEITEDNQNYSAYYIGWLSDETIFDSSFDSAETPTALVSPLAGGSMIEGWNQGIIGMKIGGIREISIPAELAYGDQAQGSIPANSPLKFVVMLIPSAEQIDWSDEMYELYYEIYGSE